MHERPFARGWRKQRVARAKETWKHYGRTDNLKQAIEADLEAEEEMERRRKEKQQNVE